MYKNIAGAVLTLIATQAQAGTQNGLAFFVPSVPTLGELGLLGLTLVVAVAGGIAVRRRRK